MRQQHWCNIKPQEWTPGRSSVKMCAVCDLWGNDCMGACLWSTRNSDRTWQIYNRRAVDLKARTHGQKHTDMLPTQLETLHRPAASVNLITTTPLTLLPLWPNDYICSLLTLWPCRGDKKDPLTLRLCSDHTANLGDNGQHQSYVHEGKSVRQQKLLQVSSLSWCLM